MSSTATTSFLSQFGEQKLINSSSSTEVSPSDALAGKDYVMLYFSAHWCPPCKRFTPVLIDLYKKIKTEKNVELIFCSLDNVEDDYKEYISDMPWFCMPFEAKESKVLASKYKAEGIPHLVVLDGEGNVITMDGTSEVGDDKEGKNFPWKPKSLSELWPDKILVSKGEGEGSDDTFLASSELKDKYLMLYFSAFWCPPCRAFTPKLSDAYTKMKALRDDFELVFISSDKDEDSCYNYFKKMAFCVLPYEHRDVKAALSKKFSVSGIPKLVMLGPVDEDGERPLINDNARPHIESGDFAEFPFHKKNYGDVESADGLEDTKSVIIFCENGDDDEQDAVKDVVKMVAAKVKEIEGDEEIYNVHWAVSSGGLSSRIRDLTKLPSADKSDDPVMIMLDINDRGAFYKSDFTDITVEHVLKFIGQPGERLQLG